MLPHLFIMDRERSPWRGLGLAWEAATPLTVGKRKEKPSPVQVGFRSQTGLDSRWRVKWQVGRWHTGYSLTSIIALAASHNGQGAGWGFVY